MTVQELFSRFAYKKKLKVGGQKTVYKATDFSGEVVALKIITNALDKRVLQEIEIIQNLNLPNVPRIIESGFVIDESKDEEVLYC